MPPVGTRAGSGPGTQARVRTNLSSPGLDHKTPVRPRRSRSCKDVQHVPAGGASLGPSCPVADLPGVHGRHLRTARRHRPTPDLRRLAGRAGRLACRTGPRPVLAGPPGRGRLGGGRSAPARAGTATETESALAGVPANPATPSPRLLRVVVAGKGAL